MKYRIADAHCDRLSKADDATSIDVTGERLTSGGVALQLFAMFSGATPEGAYQKALVQRERFLQLAQKGEYRIVQEAALPEDESLGLLTIEGGEILEGSLERLREFSRMGVRAIGLTWNHPNELGNPAKLGGGGLTITGQDMVKEMNRLHIAVDVSHLNERGFWDVERMCGPFMATHSNARSLCDHFRNLTDDQIKAIVDHEGFIGINFYPVFLSKDRPATLDDVFRHIEHMLDLGGENAVGFGSDFDGIDEKVVGLEHPGKFEALMELLEKHGYSERLCRKIAGENLVAFFHSL